MVNRRRVSGQNYQQAQFQWSIVPANGTVMYYLGRVPASRYMQAAVQNGGIGASLTNCSLLGKLFKGS